MLNESIIESFGNKIATVKMEIAKVLVGQGALIDGLLTALLCDGHVLVEGVPGIAKTLAVKTMADVLNMACKRIQFTPDLLPADLLGLSVYNPKEGTFSVQKGPVFTNIVIADEINRAPPKVQSALLEVMQERQVTIAGNTFATGSPFFVLATQNPIEQEGTYPLPEAEVDRFMFKLLATYPDPKEEQLIMQRMANKDLKKCEKVLEIHEIEELKRVIEEIYIDEKIYGYITDLIFGTRYPQKMGLTIASSIQYGASPRASISFCKAARVMALFSKRSYVTPSDVKAIAHSILRHRIILSYEAEAEERSAEDVIDTLLAEIPVP